VFNSVNSAKTSCEAQIGGSLCALLSYLDLYGCCDRLVGLESGFVFASGRERESLDMAAAGGKTYSFKVVLLGEGCVGKTSLVLRYCENKFNDKHITTLQVSESAELTLLDVLNVLASLHSFIGVSSEIY